MPLYETLSRTKFAWLANSGKRRQPSARIETRGTDILIIREIGPWGQRPVWSVLTDLYEYVRDRVVIPLKPFFVASPFSSP